MKEDRTRDQQTKRLDEDRIEIRSGGQFSTTINKSVEGKTTK